ncbi:hypothetical protein [Nocardioides yefusunii]|uniref:Uncharacterized protein n=1 Tax=Nocardioides yefusunii TaxID=2500546 RepID=A0ABW1QZR1_9ACTN|nr:hypothetical protein [Nocardioides yefusunii]
MVPRVAQRLWSRVLFTFLLMVTLALVLAVRVPSSPSANEEQEAATAAFLASNEVSVDLSAPPTREQLAVADGRGTVYHRKPDGSPFDVSVRMADGHLIRLEATLVAVTTRDGGAPVEMLVAHDDISPAELRATLDMAVADLGVEPLWARTALEDVRRAKLRKTRFSEYLSAQSIALPEHVSFDPSVKDGVISLHVRISWTPPTLGDGVVSVNG